MGILSQHEISHSPGNILPEKQADVQWVSSVFLSIAVFAEGIIIGNGGSSQDHSGSQVLLLSVDRIMWFYLLSLLEDWVLSIVEPVLHAKG